MSETRILVSLLWMYFPRNWELGSACKNIGNSGGGGLVRHWIELNCEAVSALYWSVSRHHTQKAAKTCRFVQVFLEDGLHISTKHVSQMLNKSIYFALCWLLCKLYFKMGHAAGGAVS
jgi:hypothetical protein